MREFAIIDKYFAPLGRSRRVPDLALGIGDDAALIDDGLLVSTDVCVEGTHFYPAMPPYDIGWRALATAVSDLAAMGAQPQFYLLALSLTPARGADGDWLAGLAAGLAACGRQIGITLAGGDLVASTSTQLAVTVLGHSQSGDVLCRHGAAVGDLLLVTGEVGAAAAGLCAATERQAQAPPADTALHRAWWRYHRPSPRLDEGMGLLPYATSMTDTSDGLVAAVCALAQASGLGAEVALADIPMTQAWGDLRVAPDEQVARALLHSDDYELCCTMPADAWQQCRDAEGSGLTPIGAMRKGGRVRVRQADGQTYRDWDRRADSEDWACWQHF